MTDTPAEHTARWTREGEYIHDDGLEVAKVFLGADGDEARFAEILQTLNERAGLLERVRKLEEALKASRQAWIDYGQETDPEIMVSADHHELLETIDAALQPEQETAK